MCCRVVQNELFYTQTYYGFLWCQPHAVEELEEISPLLSGFPWRLAETAVMLLMTANSAAEKRR
jgi:hypothetical protein